jgi:menaquinol-cytochrome c reductase iron-sulfur subunit
MSTSDDHSDAPPPEDAASHPEAPPATPEELARREFLTTLSIAVGVAGGAVMSVPGLGFVIAPLFRNAPREWRPVGKVGDFDIGATVNVVFSDASPLPWAGVTAKTGAWLRRVAAEEFVVFSVNCAHLGCPVRWMERAHLFMCPCHGGVYYEDGRVAAGPPPHALTQYPVRVRDGEVEICTEPIPIG